MDKKSILLIQKFIRANRLSFKEGRRNSDSVIVAGYALYVYGEGYSTSCTDTEVYEIIKSVRKDLDFEEEFDKVFNYAELNGYGNYWYSAAAKSLYKF